MSIGHGQLDQALDSSDDDSEYEDLVGRGYELHPLVRFRRMRSTKRAELAYHYNPVGGDTVRSAGE